MPRTADRVAQTTTTSGTGSLTLGSAVPGFTTFDSAFAVGEPFYYTIEEGASFECGIGHLSSSTILVRDEVTKSSNAGSLVSFTGATKNVFNSLSDHSRRKIGYILNSLGVV